MSQHIQLDASDIKALRVLDSDFIISADGEVAKLVGEMEVTVVRPADDGGARLLLTLKLPNGELFDVRLARAQLLQQLNIEMKS
jgi:hypothetical protein